jgi:hypothetical protein
MGLFALDMLKAIVRTMLTQKGEIGIRCNPSKLDPPLR